MEILKNLSEGWDKLAMRDHHQRMKVGKTLKVNKHTPIHCLGSQYNHDGTSDLSTSDYITKT